MRLDSLRSVRGDIYIYIYGLINTGSWSVCFAFFFGSESWPSLCGVISHPLLWTV